MADSPCRDRIRRRTARATVTSEPTTASSSPARRDGISHGSRRATPTGLAIRQQRACYLGIVHRVLLLGPDDDARRALHLLIDRRGLAVVAANELESAKKHLAAAISGAAITTSQSAAAGDRDPAHA